MEIKVNNKITLREISIDDANIIFNKINEYRESLKTWLPWINSTKSQKDTENFINSIINSEKDLVFIIKHQLNFAGIIGLKEIDVLNHRAEIGYWLLPCFEGKGIMTLCCKAITDYSFNHLNINRIQIKCATKNQKSNAIPNRLNYFFEGIEREGEFINDKYFDLNLYSALKNEW